MGAGAVGAILALELAHHNVACIVVERAVTGPRHPGLDFLAGRSMELLRRLGLTELIREHGVSPDHPTGLEWSQGLDDPPILVSPGGPAGVESDDGGGPAESHQLVSGAQLAKQLRDAVRRHPLVDLREGWTFTGMRVEPDGAVAELVEVGSGDRHFVEARHVAGCDGAHSTVRRCLEVPMEQLAAPARHCSVYFRNEDLTRRFARRGLSTVIVGGVALVARGDHDTWVGHLGLAPDEPITTDPVAMLRAMLGVRLDATEVLGVTQWDDSLAVATTYQRGPAYLVGEAAHRFHPVTDSADISIGDAIDLGWKLAAVINGWGGPGLLASYELERRPRALIDREMLARSLETRRRFSRLAKAGATRELLAEVLQQEPHLLGTAGVQVGDRLASSVIWADDRPQWPGPDEAPPTIAPGGRPPAVRLADGSQLFDRLGLELTLVDLTDDDAGRPLVDAARERGIPMAHLVTTDPAVRARWDHPLVLVRPDQHVAWRSGAAPDDWDTVLDLVTGRKTT
ncbi:FAD-dependent monooxygenase [Phytohabitans sp. ZYX-F-186]|uniref:FAD-dependent monooxygenase n=1 Tax=Phytohabitans maris TaxID=3071409 RepID=A0ABU0ZF39_9ACTN|nr:FAD-dependent monooxygenase [Phytohabitans sp. ZYX-F-186]MDQ7905674.1 FAD-dependent monooxygenase [Phytohabitans sp. ZYX-F-186]